MAIVLAAWVLCLGCGGPADDLPRQAISGTVSFKGKPLEAGMIQFQPASASATTAGGAGIRAGQYAISQSEGLVPGQYQVKITSENAAAGQPTSGPPAMPGDAPPPPKEPIPAKYNAQTTLTANVTKEGPNTFNFDLKEK